MIDPDLLKYYYGLWNVNIIWYDRLIIGGLSPMLIILIKKGPYG